MFGCGSSQLTNCFFSPAREPGGQRDSPVAGVRGKGDDEGMVLPSGRVGVHCKSQSSS